jgi:hypothetical protein
MSSRRFLVLLPATPAVVPYVTQRAAEKSWTPPLIHRRGRPGLAYADESYYDRDSFGVLWVRAPIIPEARRGEPRFDSIHPYRQRRAMLDMLCQVCGKPPAAGLEGPHLFLMGGERPIREGEVTASPPVCEPCALESIQACPRLRKQHVAAIVKYTPAWGVAGIRHHPVTLLPITDGDLEFFAYSAPVTPWIVAARSVVQLWGVTAVDLAA